MLSRKQLNFYLPIKKKLAEIRQELVLQADQPLCLLLAVSGGADSVALVKIFHDLKDACNLKLGIAHFDHALRDESLAEAKFVEDLASSLSLAFFSKRAIDTPDGKNLEAWARERRYNFLYQTLDAWNGHLILTAHHQNDQAETLLFRFIMGRLLRDSHSIARFDLERRILRPMLDLSRKQIEELLVEAEQTFVFDSSNNDLRRTRNRIRHDLIKKLEDDYNPSLVSTLGSLADRLSRDEDYIWQVARNEYLKIKDDLRVWNLDRVDLALIWRVLILLAEDQLGGDAGTLSYYNLQKAVEMLRSDDYKGNVLDLGVGISISFESSGKLKFFHTPKCR